jgi:hypothetical protein
MMIDDRARTDSGQTFCIHHNMLRLFLICGLVKVYPADTIRVAHDRNPRTLLDLAHESIAPARDSQADVPVLGERRCHFGACLDGLDECSWERRAREGDLDRAG